MKVKADGTVKVLDFGLAKAFQPDASDPGLSQSPTISLTAAATQMGMVVGTASYMAPEQAKGKVVDKRADVWALGVVLFEMLTGQKPFVGDDVSDTLALVLKFEPEWDALPPDTPPRIRQLIQTCLQKDPKRRVHDVADVRLAMEGVFETRVASDTGVTPMLRVWQQPVSLVLAGLALVLIAGFVVWSVIRPGPEAVRRFEIPLRVEEAFAGGGRHMVAVSPDGRYIVYSTSSGLSLRSLSQLTPLLLVGNGDAREPFFSPDGQWIGFQANGQLQKVSITGGAPVTLCAAGRPLGASWGTDDMILVGQGPQGILQVPGNGGTPNVLIAVEDGEQAHGPQMLPGDEWVLFTLRPPGTTSWNEADIVMQSVVTKERVVLIEGGRDARYVPTGHLVYGLNSVVLAVPFDLSARQVTGGPVALVEGVLEAPPGAMQFSVARSGSLVYVPGVVSGDGYALAWVGRDGQEDAILAELQTYVHPRISPDGTRIALGLLDDSSDVWIWHNERETWAQLTFDEADDGFPLWTPDSARVVFTSNRDGGGLFWKAADGTGEVERLLESSNNPVAHAWSTVLRSAFLMTAPTFGSGITNERPGRSSPSMRRTTGD